VSITQHMGPAGDESRPHGAAEAYRLLFERVDNMVCTLDLEGRFTSINRAGERLTGYGADELIGRLAVELIAPEHRDDAVRQFARRLAGEGEESVDESMVLCRDGRHVPIQVTSTLFSSEGVPAGVLAVVHDLTDRVLAAEALARSQAAMLENESRFRGSFEAAASGMALVAPDGRFLEVNRSLCDIVGYPADELLELTFQDITHPDDLEADLEHVQQMLRGDVRSYQMTKRYLHKGGEIVWGMLSVSLVRGAAGEPLYFVSQIQDVTERVTAEAERDRLRDELGHAQRLEALGRLAGGVAHDFNNMLTAIRGYTELLLGRLSPGTIDHSEVTQIRKAAEQAAQLPQHLLAFGRKQQLQPRRTDVHDLIATTARMLGDLAADGIDVVVEPAAECGDVLVDPSSFGHALVNLALNARDAMPGGGTLTISTRLVTLDEASASDRGVAAGRYLVVSVADDGIGMDEETRHRAFEPFFTTKAPGEGSGLGLASVYGTVTQNGGFVRLTSEPGVGSTFEIHLPSLAAGADEQAADQGPLVVLAEDEEIVRDLATEILTRAGFRVVATEDGVDALEIVKGQRGEVAALVTDVVMPRLGGRALAEQARAVEGSLPIVFISGFNGEAVDAREFGSGAVMLQKPFLPDELVEALRTVAAPGTPTPADAPSLTPREREILALVADGMTNDMVAATLSISPETVQSHVRNVMGKLEADSRTEAVATALRMAIIA
jgi:PAS domain S-box-containing protein